MNVNDGDLPKGIAHHNPMVPFIYPSGAGVGTTPAIDAEDDDDPMIDAEIDLRGSTGVGPSFIGKTKMQNRVISLELNTEKLDMAMVERTDCEGPSLW